MTQTFYTKWQSSVLADAGNYVSKEYNNFQTALLSEISKYAKAVDAAVVARGITLQVALLSVTVNSCT